VAYVNVFTVIESRCIHCKAEFYDSSFVSLRRNTSNYCTPGSSDLKHLPQQMGMGVFAERLKWAEWADG
jgi:hypothetical protein